MDTTDISIIVLTTGDLTRAHRVMEAYSASPVRETLRAQFIYLVNRKDLSFPPTQTTVANRDGIDVVYIGNDRYFGSCEENLFRIRDVIDIVKPLALIIGESDEINWPNLAEAARIAAEERLDAMLINVQNIQNRRSGGTSSIFAACNLPDETPQNRFFRALVAGRTLSSNVAWPATVSMFGPVDWFAFIGHQLYSRHALRGLLKYRFTEHVYSFVYMQALYFSSSRRRYRLFMPEVVNRISNDFLSEHAGGADRDLGWLREHRVVHGQARTLWIANVHHLLQIEDDALFSVLAMSLTVAHRPSGSNDEISLLRDTMLRQMIFWIASVLGEKANGQSYYLGTPGPRRLDDEFWACLRFLKRLHNVLRQYEGEAVARCAEGAEQAAMYLALFFDDVEGTEPMIAEALAALNVVLSTLDEATLRYLQETSFKRYMQALTA
ncbi:hypothetical protein WKR88_19200 [Trinickia caryophylli]|uniref:Uncharacterized protein n=1 Tax=Trinickia caryophylli TaxID=28094 RepID=A0A1X7DFD0_TRICW|nr:hypothetical protein [Trinickia caryophylli]PMS08883.1 hypothetical protein C0Z17_27925 [Trinickia caryophylli]TRX16908.1 hypothetical protein FNF07_00780 [Trinickia caryophylli]WQE12361.1 hypothetical protein U0034_02760 [Trinickia caryophylli]SMF14572.1 hypothetical protein SAMN06295900_103121 [Trinickia caryophylli]GLU31491.1 hypothetical protein Busp01_13330 [Trinickia caryophylli]